MGQIHPPSPALLFTAAFSRYEAALEWAKHKTVEAWGPMLAQSPVFSFSQTDYYTDTMGPGLLKTFFAFERPFDLGHLPQVKLQSNRWEEEYAATAGLPESRPLNLDPGYISLGKMVLASTKGLSHRIYLADGIYGEVTLYYSHHAWHAWEWTFADYRREDYQQFFTQCRDCLHLRIQEGWPR